MSRSYKKTPVMKDGGKSHKKEKRIASRRIRSKEKEEVIKEERLISDGMDYKRHVEQYDVVDIVQRWSKEEAVAMYEKYAGMDEPSSAYFPKDFRKDYPTLESFLQHWEKCMKRK